MSEDKKNYKKYLLKKQLKFLREKKGYHTELITLMIPPDRKISDVTNYLKNEISESSNIKSKLTRKNVIDSITSLLQKLKHIKEPPENGLIMFSGAIPQGNTAGTEKNELYIIEPIEPVQSFRYYCSSEFYLKPLEDMLREKNTYGIVVIDKKDVAVGWVRGSHVEIVRTSSSGIAGKHHAGGQSQRRFQRLHDEHVNYFLSRSAELTNEIFVPMLEKGELEGIFLGGAGHTKYKFLDKGDLDYRLADKVIQSYDIDVGGEEGIRAVMMKAQDQIENVQYVKEKKLMQEFLYNLSNENGLIAYGEKEVRKALNMGAVDTLILSEALKMYRVTLECEQCGFTAESTLKSKQFEEFEDKVDDKNCPECKSSLLNITKKEDIVEELGRLADSMSSKIEIISDETEEGEMLISTFGGIAAILRYRIA